MGDGGLRERVADLLRDDLLGTERIERKSCAAPLEWTELLLGQRKIVMLPDAGEPAKADVRVLFPGSFNPLHRGHKRMVEIAAERLGQPVWLEISITNVDKPPLDFLAIHERIGPLKGYNICLTRASTFVEKAELFSGATFIVGADTLARIADARYYHGRYEDRDAALSRLQDANVRFLTFGRTIGDRFTTLADLALPSTLAGLCEEVAESEFHEDVASTQIRAKSSHV